MSLNPDAVDPILSRGSSIDHSFPSDSSFHAATSSDNARTSFTLASDDDVEPGPEDDYDVFDLELIPIVGGKVSTTELSFRKRNITGISSARPTYKVEKRVVSHLFGKKNMSVTINRNEGLSAITPPSRSRRDTKGYAPIFEALDANPRQATMVATPDCVLLNGARRAHRADALLRCVRSSKRPYPRRTGRRGLSFLSPCHIRPWGRDAAFREPHSRSPIAAAEPSILWRGYFLFDAHSQGRKELLFTMWCTRYEKRHKVRRMIFWWRSCVFPSCLGTSPSAKHLPGVG
ncbi:hypothetical protein CPB85DRAFT_1416076 [Mucidula mucida]|nr:hypothetical protein CPB85DRAFT_1416076 [Mucidula mucida]